MDITIYSSHTESLIQQKALPPLLQRLPASLHARAHRYQSELSAYNYVIGRLLLQRGLEDMGLDSDLDKIEIQENGKPVLSGVHFNISHSDHQVICGFSKEGRLGVDLEKIKPIDFEDFISMFSEHEWAAINGSDDPLRIFYWFWTRKESIIKALGLTLGYLHEIELDVSVDHFVVDGERWFLRDVHLGDRYAGAVCYEGEIGEVEVLEIITT